MKVRRKALPPTAYTFFLDRLGDAPSRPKHYPRLAKRRQLEKSSLQQQQCQLKKRSWQSSEDEKSDIVSLFDDIRGKIKTLTRVEWTR